MTEPQFEALAPALTASYDWLKTLPEFAGWVDV